MFQRRGGFSTIELMVVVAIIGIFAAVAVPSLGRWMRTQRIKAAVRSVGDSFHFARTQAIRTGNVHIVFLGANGGTDACGNALLDPKGNPVPVVVLDDGQPGAPQQNCCIDPGETFTTEPAEQGVFWGTTNAAVTAPTDTGAGAMATGSTFADQNNAQRSWVMFGPDGIPVGFTNACNAGPIGSGGGAVYVTNTEHDFAVSLSALGAVNVHNYEQAGATWTN